MSHFAQSARDRSSCTLRIDKLSKRYGPQVLFEDLSLEVGSGEAVRIVGPNGSGKTQLLLCLGGFVRADSGCLLINANGTQRDLAGTPWDRDPSLRFVPSLPGDICHLPVALAAYALSRSLSAFSLDSVACSAAGRFFPKWKERLDECVGERLGAARPMSSLSIGQQKRLLLASVLLCGPRALTFLVDEPLAGLDSAGIRVALDLLGRVRAEGAGLLVAEHRDEIAEIPFDREVSLPHLSRSAEGTAIHAEVLPVRQSTDEAPAATGRAVLQLRRARVGYPGAEVSCEDLALAPGEMLLIEGSNGSGKTGFLKGLLGIEPSRFWGELEFEGESAVSLAGALPRGRVRYLDQTRMSFDHLRVADAVRAAAAGGASLPDEVRDAVQQLGSGRRVATLSSGNRALLGLCQALATVPALAALDEPFANVDSDNRARMIALIQVARANRQTAFLIAEHTGDDLPSSRVCRIDSRGAVGLVLESCPQPLTPALPRQKGAGS